MPIIEVTNLVKKYPKPDNSSELFAAVDGISFSIEAGEIFGILGPNGAGKTTTLEMLEGLNDIDAGEVHVDGIDVRKHPYEVKKIIGVRLQANEYFDHLSLRELLDLFAGLYHSRDFEPDAILGSRRPDGQGPGKTREFIRWPAAAIFHCLRAGERAESTVPG